MRASTPLVVGGVGLLIGVVLVLRVMGAEDWDPTALTAFGQTSEENTAYAEERLGPVVQREAKGHDGRFFFVQSHDPLLLDPETHASVLDRPAYRSQRMLYPLLAGGFGLLGSESIVVAMIVVNVLALGAGTWVTARIARHLGRSPWWGLAFGLNLGLINELTISAAGLVAMCLAMVALLAILEQQRFVAVLAMAGAVLSREAMLLVAVGAAVWALRSGERRHALALVAAPGLAAGLWALYVRWRLAWPQSTEVEEIGMPFVGFFDALTTPGPGTISKIIAPVLLLLLLRFAWHVATRPSLLGLATVGFVPLAIVLTEQVWLAYFDITRAVAPALTGYVLAVFVEPRGEPADTLARRVTDT